MKKLFAFLLTLAMVLSLAACGGKTDPPSDASGSAPAQGNSGGSGSAAPTKLTLILRAGTYADVIKE